jgi:hypothetical protein
MKLNFTFLKYMILLAVPFMASAQEIKLASKSLDVAWEKQENGWHVKSIAAEGKMLEVPAGYYTLLYNAAKPRTELVQNNQEGAAHSFYPSTASKTDDGKLIFGQELPVADMKATWSADPDYLTDIRVRITLKVKKDGFYSIASPTLAKIGREQLSWGMVPGGWYGRELQHDLILSTKYSMGLPDVPVMAPEKSTMSLCPLITTKNGVTIAVIPDPGTASDPWATSAHSRGVNKVSLSTMDRHFELTPVAYSPILGQEGSQLKAGQEVSFSFRYSIRASNWFPVFQHAVEDIYQFKNLLKIQRQEVALTKRIELMQRYLSNDEKSKWNTWKSTGLEIGANGQKNADLGAMWMLARASEDSVLNRHLPFVRNYKLAQQQTGPGFFQYAALGEYGGKDGFASEVGNFVEPIFTTYYTLIDMGNLLLFQPEDAQLKERLRLAADKMMIWQHPAGNWDVAYDNFSHQLTFPMLQDLRPTWYGMLVAHRILKDKKYLDAARKGADWLIKNGVDKGYYLGVCGDAQNIWDFATAQSAQAFLDLYEMTGEEKYKLAAIEAGRVYATSIFTHPIAGKKLKTVNGVNREDWEINQTGLGVEHPQGSAPGSGPILITSFTGLFIRLHELTKDAVFLDMARGAARGRHAFMDPESGQTVYYWKDVNRIKERVMTFPHQAYWQIGWITDYLLSEVKLRSGGKVVFPRGFMTPKVGPHQAYGFEPGTIFSAKASLRMPESLLESNNPSLEWLAAVNEKEKKLYLMVLNQSVEPQAGSVKIDLSKVVENRKVGLGALKVLQGEKLINQSASEGKLGLKLASWGLSVIELSLK